jgi:DNA-binding response OmpR family regulator
LAAAAYGLGAAYILSKPFRPAELLQAMNKYIRANGKPPAGRED